MRQISGIWRYVFKMFSTIARGHDPQEAFMIAKLGGLNGDEIKEQKDFKMVDVPKNISPFAFVSNYPENKIPKKIAGCILIRPADPPGKKSKKGYIRPDLNAYLFFGK